MNPIIDVALERACRNAAEVMGGDLKRMSCFISNWVAPERRPFPSIRETFVNDRDMDDQSWEDWCPDLNKLAAAEPGRYTADAIENCGAECWRDFYGDGYTAADAWHEDGAYD